MKKIKEIGIVMLLLASSIPGFGQTTETREIESFNALQTDGLVQTYLQEGEKESLRLEVKGIDLVDVSSFVKNGVLTVKTEGNHNGEDIKIYVIYRQLNRISVAGASKVFGNSPVRAKALTVATSDAGDASLNVDVDSLKIKMTGASNLTISGRAKSVKIDTRDCESGTLDREGLNAAK